jgi:hypothetical protein
MMDACSSVRIRTCQQRLEQALSARSPPPTRECSEGLARDRSKLCAMVSSEVQRTLVKSPPELWAEISDPESLARHLGEFGEIRITRVHPEQRVEWESDEAHGTVAIKPSGWGTKVKLTVTRELPHADETPAAADAPAESEGEATPVVEDAGVQPQAEAGLDAQHLLDALLDAEPISEREPAEDLELELAEAIEPEPVADAQLERPEPASQPRRGFFARLFGRRRSTQSAPDELVDGLTDTDATVEDETPDELQKPAADETIAEGLADLAHAVDEPPAEPASQRTPSPEPFERAAPEREPVVADDDRGQSAAEQSAVDIAAELRVAEELAAEQVTAVLSGVLDRLGAAHHRPFSRS